MCRKLLFDFVPYLVIVMSKNDNQGACVLQMLKTSAYGGFYASRGYITSFGYQVKINIAIVGKQIRWWADDKTNQANYKNINYEWIAFCI